jgi:uncharacterized repeat protein (TIGR02543 family)
MMKAKRFFAGAAVGLALLGMLACEMGGTGTDAGTEGKAAVRIEVEEAGDGARTVLPTVALTDAVSWKVFGAEVPDGERTELETFSSLDALKAGLYLDPGTWDFTLEGYNGEGGLILRGTIAGKEIKLGQTNTLSFRVAPVKADHGRFVIGVTLPGGFGINRADVSLAGEAVTAGVTLEGDKVVFENGSYPAGDHYFTIKLYKESELYGVVSDVVQVRKNLSSEKEYTLTERDLNLQYTITYHVNEGDLAGENPRYYRSTDAAFDLPTAADFTRTGYTFGGWYPDEELDGDKVNRINPQEKAENKDFYAKWTANTYTVVYDKNAGDATGSTASSGHIYDAAKELTANGFSRTGYTFNGWTGAADGTGETYTDGQSVTNLSADDGDEVRLYARWKVIVYTIDYVLNGGNDDDTGNPDTYTIESGEITLAAPTWDSHRFDGWYDNSGYSGNAHPTIPAGNTGDKAFYAKWKALVEIEVKPLPEGDPSPTISFNDGTQKFSAVGSGYTSYKWYWDGAAIQGANENTYALPSDKAPGKYTLTVEVTTAAGDTLSSAGCLVTINTQ